MLSDGHVLGAELPLGPGDALARLTGGLAGRDGLPEVVDRAGGIALQVLEPGPPAKGGEVALEAHHRVVRLTGPVVAPELEIGVAEHAVRIAVLRVELDRLQGLRGRFTKLVTRGEHVGEVARGAGIAGRDLERLSQRLLRQGEIAQVPGLAGLLNVRIAEPMVGARIARVAPELVLLALDGLIRRALGLGRGRPERENQEDRYAPTPEVWRSPCHHLVLWVCEAPSSRPRAIMRDPLSGDRPAGSGGTGTSSRSRWPSRPVSRPAAR